MGCIMMERTCTLMITCGRGSRGSQQHYAEGTVRCGPWTDGVSPRQKNTVSGTVLVTTGVGVLRWVVGVEGCTHRQAAIKY